MTEPELTIGHADAAPAGCPTCSHTFECVQRNALIDRTIHHCPRCGTMKIDNGGHATVYVPKLVISCRTLEARVKADVAMYGKGAAMLLKWFSAAGITESINRPEDRP